MSTEKGANKNITKQNKKTVRQFSQEFSTDLIPFIAFMEEYRKFPVYPQDAVHSSGAETFVFVICVVILDLSCFDL